MTNYPGSSYDVKGRAQRSNKVSSGVTVREEKKVAEPKHQTPLRHPTLSRSTEAPWRVVLESMAQKQLVEAAISAAWEIKQLRDDVDRLWKKHSKEVESRKRAPAARLATDPKQATKNEIKRIWAERWLACEPSAWNQAAFAREMQEQHSIIEDPRTIEEWIRTWKKEAPRQSQPEFNSRWFDLDARWKARPEIHKLLNYLPPGFFDFD